MSQRGSSSLSPQEAASQILDLSYDTISRNAAEAARMETLQKESELRSILNISYDDLSVLREEHERKSSPRVYDPVDLEANKPSSANIRSMEFSLDHSEDKALMVAQSKANLSFRNISLYIYTSLLIFGLLFLIFAPVTDDKPLAN